MSIVAIVTLSGGHHIHWGVLSVSVTNLAIIIAMVVVFVLALVLPFPHQDAERHDRDGEL